MPDSPKRFGWGQTVDASLPHFGFDLLFDAGHPHLEELVQVRVGNAEELQTLQERICGIERLVQDPLVEFQPTELTVEKVRSRAAGHTCCGSILTVVQEGEKLHSRHKA